MNVIGDAEKPLTDLLTNLGRTPEQIAAVLTAARAFLELMTKQGIVITIRLGPTEPHG